MVSRDRWLHAQEYEAGFWDEAANGISEGEIPELDWYEWRAGRLLQALDELGRSDLVNGNGIIVEIGSGPVGVVSFLPAFQSLAIDPLQSRYSSREALVRPRSRRVVYVEGVGEALPVDAEACDLVIIENCIDHVQSVERVMEEIHRVLRPGGLLYLTVNCRTGVGYYVHRILATLQLDPGHPHTFTRRRTRRRINEHGFEIFQMDAESYLSSTRRDLIEGGTRSRAKALLGISEFTVRVFAEKYSSS